MTNNGDNNKNKEDLRERLSEEAYKVTQQKATEPPFTGEYYQTKDDGRYHCAVCGAVLFDSSTKFDSGTGWPSFYEATGTDTLRLTPDESEGMVRTEVSCRKCGAHLGHVFNDAPSTPTGERYCINSCALSLETREKDEEKE